MVTISRMGPKVNLGTFLESGPLISGYNPSALLNKEDIFCASTLLDSRGDMDDFVWPRPTDIVINFRGLIFVYKSKSAKTAKLFPLEIYPLCGILNG